MQLQNEKHSTLKVSIRDKGVAFKTTFLVSPECDIDFTLAARSVAFLHVSLRLRSIGVQTQAN
jgi:hypothetical protein